MQCKTTAKVTSCTIATANTYGAYDVAGYCIPDYETLDPSIQTEWETMKARFKSSTSGGFVVDLYDARWVILMSFAVSLLLSLGYVKFMDWCAYWLAWVSVAIIQVSFVLLGWFAYSERNEFLADSNASNDKYAAYLFWGAVLSWGLAVVWYICLACNFRSLKVSIAIIETAADWFADTKRIIFVSAAYFCVGLVVLVTWLGAMVGVASMGTITVDCVQH